MSFDIRPAECGDTEAILALSRSTLAAHRDRLPEYFSSDALPAEGFLSGLFAKRHKGAAFVAEQAGEVVGWTGMRRFTMLSGDKTHDDLGLIIDITVADTAQRQGIGRALIEAIIDEARAQGVTKIQGDVWRGSPSGGLLESAGLAHVRGVHEMRLQDAHSGYPIMHRVGRFFEKLLPWLTVLLSMIVFAYVFGG